MVIYKLLCQDKSIPQFFAVVVVLFFPDPPLPHHIQLKKQQDDEGKNVQLLALQLDFINQ